MKITARVTYAVLAVFELALHPEESRIQAKELSQRRQIPLRFLEQILIQLKKAGIVRSVRGAGGGYALARRSTQITLRDIMEAVEGEVAVFDPKTMAEASISSIWRDIEQEFLEKLQSITVRDLIQRKIREDKVIVYHI